jgi:WD40 repeat protein
MDFERAKAIVLELLGAEGMATDLELVDALDGDEKLYRRVRGRLILEDLADDKKGVGLVYTGAAHEAAPHVPSTPRPRRIFISYGRKDAQDLAFKLERELTERGHVVWLDKTQVRGGVSWEQQIEHAILSHDVFVALLSPAAVRRPDGVCLDEISMARYNGRHIVPAMVHACRAPLGIYRLDWVDFQRWTTEAGYASALTRLLGAIAGEPTVEGTDAQLRASLEPLEFGAELARLVRDFTGRQWLVKELQQWLATDRQRVFFITGDPGTGKSAVMAHLVERRPEVVAYHFCVAGLRDSLDPLVFCRSLAAQLVTQLPGYRAALDLLDVESILAEPEAGTVFRRLIVDPLERVDPEGGALILVDALDEAASYGRTNIATLLRDHLSDLPSWTRLVMTSRKEPALLDMFSRYGPREIDAARVENEQDVQQYLQRVLCEPEIAAALTAGGGDTASVAAAIARRGEGNFLYVTQVVDGLRAGDIDPSDPDDFPDGLVGIYQRFFSAQFPSQDAYAAIRPLLDVVCASREPLTAAQLSTFTGTSVHRVHADMERVAVYFPEREGTFRAFHKSVTDWLVGEAGHSRRYRVDVHRGHGQLAASLAAEWQRDGLRANRFVLAHLPAHLTGAEQWDELCDVLTDAVFVEAKVRAGMVNELQADHFEALTRLPATQEEQTDRRARARRRARWTRDLTARAGGSVDSLEVIGSAEPWSDSRLRAENLRIAQDASPADLVRVFAQFVTGERHHLAEHGRKPGFCTQQILNHSDFDPILGRARVAHEQQPKTQLLLVTDSSLPSFNYHPACLRTLPHKTSVFAICHSADGTLTISGSTDDMVRVWNAGTGECLHTLSGHTGIVNSVSATADGARAMSASQDKTLRLWDLATKACIRTLEGHSRAVTSVSLSADGKHAVSAGEDGTVKIWDVDAGVCVRSLDGHTGTILSVAVSADRTLAVTGGKDRALRVWDLTTGEFVRTLDGHTHKVSAVSMSADGQRVVSGSGDKTVRVWNTGTGECLHTLHGHSGAVLSAAVSADGRLAVSGGNDRSVRVWDVDAGGCIRTLHGHTSRVNAVSISADGMRAASGGKDRTLRMWNVRKGVSAPAPEHHEHSVHAVATSADGTLAVSASGDSTLRVWNVATGEHVRTLRGHHGDAVAIDLSADGKRAVSGGKDRKLRVWDVSTGTCVRAMRGHQNRICAVGSSGDGTLALSGSYDRVLRVWDLVTHKRLHKLDGGGVVNAIGVSADGTRAVTGGEDGLLRVWEPRAGRCSATLAGHTGSIDAAYLSADGAVAVSGGQDCSVRVWDVNEGTCLHTLIGHSKTVCAVSLSADGTLAISASKDKTLVVWDVQTGQCLSTYPAEIRGCAIGANNRIIAGDAGGMMHFLDIAAGPSQTSALRAR